MKKFMAVVTMLLITFGMYFVYKVAEVYQEPVEARGKLIECYIDGEVTVNPAYKCDYNVGDGKHYTIEISRQDWRKEYFRVGHERDLRIYNDNVDVVIIIAAILELFLFLFFLAMFWTLTRSEPKEVTARWREG